MTSHAQLWNRLDETMDLVIIGGGINGAGIARDAAQRGLKVAVVEMSDIASGTSSRSSKLVHGGVRYLELFEFGLVFESVSERRILMELAPHLVRPLSFLFPVFTHSRRSLTTISTGLKLYEVLALFRSPERPSKLKAEALLEEEPCLTQKDLVGAPLYYDCATDDTRLTIENAVAASRDGAVIATYCEAVGFEYADDQIAAVRVRNVLTQEERTVRTRAVVNATGPWTDRTVAMRQDPEKRALLRPTKGVHFAVKHDILPIQHAVVCFHPVDQRVLFALPWGDCTYVGTTDTDYHGDPKDVAATREDIDYLIEATTAYFPKHPIRVEDIHCTWAGLRPLMLPMDNKGKSESAVSREHSLIVDPDGLITIAGGKLTTYRLMSEEVVDTVIRVLHTHGGLPENILHKGLTKESLLPGAMGWPQDNDVDTVINLIRASSNASIAPDSAELLAHNYGMRALNIAELVADDPSLGARILPDRPEIMAQINYGIYEEFACTVRDILKQRTQIYYRDVQQGLTVVDKVAAHMATLLRWDADTQAHMAQQYRDEVALHAAWRKQPSSRG